MLYWLLLAHSGGASMPNQPFRPSHDGFAYTNSWPAQPAVTLPTPFGDIALGNAAGGLCGGMVFASMDYWHASVAPAPARPCLGEPVYGYIVRRLLDSWHLPAGVSQYYQWMNLPDEDRGFAAFGRRVVIERGLGWRTTKVQWPQVVADLDTGLPVALGLVTTASANPRDLGLNHQVLAYGYGRAGNHVTVYVYDPNRGQCDDVRIEFDINRGGARTAITHNLGLARPIRGFFRTAYAPLTPPGC